MTMKVRCPKCHRTLEPDTLICPYCTTKITASTSGGSRYEEVLRPRSRISIKGAGSRMSGQSKVDAIRHEIATSTKYDSSEKTRCMKCGTVNDKGTLFCRKCRARMT